MRYALHLSYFGKNYAGWQRQINALSVQEELEKALSVLLKETVEITGCGRTDTGVHAVNFYAHFDFNSELPVDLVYHTNAILGKDIALHDVFGVNDEWHARFSAKSRIYQYFLSLKSNPFLEDMSWNVPYSLDIDKMNEAAGLLLNYEEFTSFARLHGGQKTDICRVEYARFSLKNDVLVFEISADRFLRNMVRAIVGTLVDVGRSFHNVDEFRAIIEAKNRSDAGASAPAKGLFLMNVRYSPDMEPVHIKNVKDFPYL